MPLNAGPSTGFMGRIGQGLSNVRQNMPGVINAMGQNFGGPFAGTSRITGGMMRGRPGMGINSPGNQTTQQNGPNGMPPTGPSPSANQTSQTGLVKGPSKPFGNINFGNPGIMPPGGMPMLRPQPMPTETGGGLWDVYSNLAGEMGGPNRRQMFY